MTHSSKRTITIDADYEPPSVNRWTPEDDLAQKLYAPHPIDEEHIANASWSDDLFLGVLLIVVIPVAVFVLLAY